jgi:nicotinate-nucleotide pyrophosphorylase (carboxylating)
MNNADYIIDLALKEDIGDGDHSSLSTIPQNKNGKAQLLVKENGILAGVEIAKKVFKKVDPNLVVNVKINDGTHIQKGDIVFDVEGSAISILSSERTVLNFMQRLSGIATSSYRVSSLLKGMHTKVLDTRKTTPGMREFEKYAVALGGCYNHRRGLWDMIMIKDNHVDYAGGITQAVKASKEYLKLKGKKLKIEVEVRNMTELKEAIKAGIDRVMLDNFTPENLHKAVKFVAGRIETEASGGINENNILEYAYSGVDYISMGSLTHQIKSLDLSLKAVNY